jgi:acetyl-CoA carboxylase carboxyltransferase component
VKTGAIQVDSADKAARFITLCDAFNLPLVFLTDLPGFMVGSKVERAGIIRHGAKMIAAMASTRVPRICLVIRKAFAAGYYAMSCPGFEPRATIALPSAQIGAMASEAAANAVSAKHLAAMETDAEREAFIAEHKVEFEKELEPIRLASDLLVDAVVEPTAARAELIARLGAAAGWSTPPASRYHGAFPV